MSETPDHVRLNRALWDGKAGEYAVMGRRSWAEAEPSWGVWGVLDSELKLLPELRGSLEWSRRWPREEIWIARKRR